MGNNRLAALPVNNSRFYRHEKCQGVSLPCISRDCHHAYYVRKNNIRPPVSSNYLSKKGVMEYDISHSLLCGYRLWNTFHGFENDRVVPEKREFQPSILSYKKMLFYLDTRQKKSYSEWTLCILSNFASEESAQAHGFGIINHDLYTKRR